MEFMSYEKFRKNVIEKNSEIIEACDNCDDEGHEFCLECDGLGENECDCCGHDVECEECDGSGKKDCFLCNEKLKFSSNNYYELKKSEFNKLTGKCDGCEYEKTLFSPCIRCPEQNGLNRVEKNEAKK